MKPFKLNPTRIGLGIVSLLLLVSCSKDNTWTEELNSPENTFQLPPVIAEQLTEAELADIYYSTPPRENPRPEGTLDNRSAQWHFWVAFGPLTNETFYAVVGNCTPFEVPDNICFRQADCPDPNSWMGRFADAYGDMLFIVDRNPRGLSEMTHHFNNIVCLDGSGWPNFGFLPDGGSDRAQFRPSTVPGEVEVKVTPDLFLINAKVYPCNPSSLHPLCWRSSTGAYEDVEGSLTWRFSGDPTEILGQGIFGPPAPAFVTVWGWLYY